MLQSRPLDVTANMAFGVACAFPFRERRREFSSIAPHLSHPEINLVEAPAHDLADMPAGAVPGLLLLDDLSDFGKREAECLGLFYELEAIKRFCVIQPVPSGGPAGMPEQPLSLIKAKRFD
jgi:hypothetical protein